MRAQYKWSVQEEKAWRKMFFITVFSFGFAAHEDNILENIVEERCRIFTITKYMKGRINLPNVGTCVEGGKDGCYGDRDIEQEEWNGIVRFGRV